MDTERGLVKFDWNINDAHRASLRLSQTKEFEPIVVNGVVTGSSPRLSLSSSWYTLDKKSTSYALSFYDDWADNFSTETSVAYSEFNQDRDPMVGGHQPSVLVRTGTSNSGPGIFLGTEPPTHANRLNVKTWNAYFAGNWYLGDHVVKGGLDYQSDELYNLFLQNYNGNYEFNGLQAFIDGNYNRYQLANPAPGTDINNVAAALTTKQYGLFLQDTWQVTDRLSVQYGVRYDIPKINDQPTYNPCFAAAPGLPAGGVVSPSGATEVDLGPCGLRDNPNNPNAAAGGYGFSNQGTIDGNDIIQPRASFNFMIDDKSQLRGGAGVFVSNSPAVWLGNPFSNNGVAVSTYDVGAFDPATPDLTPPFNPNGSTQTPPGFAATDPGLGRSTMSLAIVDPNFQLPTVAKYTLGYDYQLPFLDSVFTVEAQHIDTIKGIKYDNINLGAPTGVLPDGRLAYQQNPNGTTTGTGGSNIGALERQPLVRPEHPADQHRQGLRRQPDVPVAQAVRERLVRVGVVHAVAMRRTSTRAPARSPAAPTATATGSTRTTTTWPRRTTRSRSACSPRSRGNTRSSVSTRRSSRRSTTATPARRTAGCSATT